MKQVTRIEEMFLTASQKVEPAERAAYLDSVCAGDNELRQQVEELLEAHAKVGKFLESNSEPPQQTQDYDASVQNLKIKESSLIGDRYKLLELIGEGGMGEVWVAEQTQPIKRKVAIKLIKAGMDSRAVLARFEAERQALAVMDHPNIAKVLDGGLHAGRPYFVMELVKGTPITEYCDTHRLTLQQRLELFVPVCQAIQHAHQKGVIHRDIKPSNVMVALYDDRPIPKVIDFGVAKATGQTLTEMTLHTGFGSVVGTPEYMSPEQANFNNLDIDTRSDVYSLGVLLYELLTGTTPVDRKSLKEAAVLEVLRIVREVEAPRPSLKLSTTDSLPTIAARRGTEPTKLPSMMRGELDWIVLKALEKDRGRRYDSANGLAADVGRYLSGEAVSACPPSLGYRLRKAYRRNKAPIVSGILIGIALIVGVAGTIWQAVERRHDREVVRLRSLQTATAAIDRAEAALVANRVLEVDTALAGLDREVLHILPTELMARVETIRKDRDTLRELESIYEEYWTVCPGSTTRDPEQAKSRYPNVFRHYGIPVGELSATSASDKVSQSLIASALTDGLATWFFLDPQVEGLRSLLDCLDPDEFRTATRAAVAADNREQLQEYAAKVDASQHPPIFSVMLAGTVSGPDNYRILQEAWRHYPDSFAIVLALAFPEPGVEETRANERIGWSRMAISLRPNNALAYYYYSLEYYWDRSEEGATTRIAALQRAIDLAPQFANAHAQLGQAYDKANRDDEALASFLRATEIDPSNIPGQAGLCGIYLVRKDWVSAAKTLRVLDKLVEPEDDFCLSSFSNARLSGTLVVLEQSLAQGLIDLNRFHELAEMYRTIGMLKPGDSSGEWRNGEEKGLDIKLFLPACAAVQAAAGRGIESPPSADRPALRCLALDWLTMDLEKCEMRFYDDNRFAKWLNATMKQWQDEPMLAEVRGARIAELPQDEQDDWKKFWEKVEAIHRATLAAHPDPAPTPQEAN